jgi:hypothetical protein
MKKRMREREDIGGGKRKEEGGSRTPSHGPSPVFLFYMLLPFSFHALSGLLS